MPQSSTTTTTTSTVPALPTNFCLTSTIGADNYVLIHNGNSGTNALLKLVGSTTYPTVKLSIDGAGHLVSSLGYKAYITTPHGVNQVLRFALNPLASYALLSCTGSYGGVLDCTAPTPTNVGTYKYFMKYDAGLQAGMSLMPITTTGITAVTWTISTDCPA